MCIQLGDVKLYFHALWPLNDERCVTSRFSSKSQKKWSENITERHVLEETTKTKARQRFIPWRPIVLHSATRYRSVWINGSTVNASLPPFYVVLNHIMWRDFPTVRTQVCSAESLTSRHRTTSTTDVGPITGLESSTARQNFRKVGRVLSSRWNTANAAAAR